jgi:phosphoglycolate phosphatase-like HAD superfamily hydrolase
MSMGTRFEALIDQKFRNGAGKPVVALDIDGTLGDYHSHFLWFAEKWLGQTMPDPRDGNPGMRLSTFMGIPHNVYRECKLAYRQGGMKRFMPAYPFAKELTYYIQEFGAEVWLCTTRPYLRLDNIDPDTREWLRRNDIVYDGVIFEGVDAETIDDGGKYYELVRQVGRERVVAAVDDLPEQLGMARDAGIPQVYIMDQPYNREAFTLSRVIRVRSLEDLWGSLSMDIAKWKESHDG